MRWTARGCKFSRVCRGSELESLSRDEHLNNAFDTTVIKNLNLKTLLDLTIRSSFKRKTKRKKEDAILFLNCPKSSSMNIIMTKFLKVFCPDPQLPEEVRVCYL